MGQKSVGQKSRLWSPWEGSTGLSTSMSVTRNFNGLLGGVPVNNPLALFLLVLKTFQSDKKARETGPVFVCM
jgi:hypothetical protein